MLIRARAGCSEVILEEEGWPGVHGSCENWRSNYNIATGLPLMTIVSVPQSILTFTSSNSNDSTELREMLAGKLHRWGSIRGGTGRLTAMPCC